LNTFPNRLREERQRLGLNQTEFAEIAGVQKRAQVNYEAGERAPDTNYMTAIAAAGADVLYILTGERSQPVAPTAELPPRVRALVANYEATDDAGKKIIEGTASLAAQPKAAKGGRK
jgi:transcriptional regulator with XRE-family HTH domain